MAEMYYVGDIDGDGDTDITDLGLILSAYGTSTCASPSPLSAEQFDRADIDGDCVISISDYTMLLGYFGVSGDLSLQSAYIWDGENRLTKIEPVSPVGGSKRIEFKYDYRGRRVEKSVYTWNTGASPQAWYANPIERRRFVWNGWLMLRETIETDSSADGTFESTRTKTYTWGRDLAGDLEAAGGIGGLLSVYDDNATTTGSDPTGDDLTYVYMYDANGNVGQLSNLSAGSASASLVAKYEYDAYGNVAASSGTYSTANTYRFSTKSWDDETGLGYWGYRYYDPRIGRWTSRDPVEELGGLNLFIAMSNRPLDFVDPRGEWSFACFACWGSLAADWGGGLAGCALGCAEYAKGSYSVGACIWDCLKLYYEDRSEDTLFNMYKDIISNASCLACGITGSGGPTGPKPTGAAAAAAAAGKKAAEEAAECALINGVYNELDCKPCFEMSKCEALKQAACWTTKIELRKKYLAKKCDYKLPGSINRRGGSKGAEKGHIERVDREEIWLAQCTARALLE